MNSLDVTMLTIKDIGTPSWSCLVASTPLSAARLPKGWGIIARCKMQSNPDCAYRYDLQILIRSFSLRHYQCLSTYGTPSVRKVLNRIVDRNCFECPAVRKIIHSLDMSRTATNLFTQDF